MALEAELIEAIANQVDKKYNILNKLGIKLKESRKFSKTEKKQIKKFRNMFFLLALLRARSCVKTLDDLNTGGKSKKALSKKDFDSAVLSLFITLSERHFVDLTENKTQSKKGIKTVRIPALIQNAILDVSSDLDLTALVEWFNDDTSALPCR